MKQKIIINSEFQKINAIFTFNEYQKKQPIVLMLHGFAMDKHEICGINDKMSDLFLERGIASMRIDFGGWGENPKSQLTEFSINSMLQNVLDTIKEIKRSNVIDQDKVVVIGFSLGASIALISQYKYNLFNGLVLVSPACDLKNDFITFLGDFGQDIFNRIDANKLSSTDMVKIPLDWRDMPTIPVNFFIDMLKYDFKKIIDILKTPMLIIAGGEDFSAVHAESLQGPNRDVHVIKEADHIYYAFTPTKNKLPNVIELVINWVNIFFINTICKV